MGSGEEEKERFFLLAFLSATQHGDIAVSLHR